MTVFTSMYDSMDKYKERLMIENQEKDNEVYLNDSVRLCKDYQSIFMCSKQRVLKRQVTR